MSPAGRPTLSGERKDDVLRIRLTTDERGSLDAAAATTGQATGTWLRDVGLNAAAEIAAQQVAIKPASKKAAKKKA